MIIKKVRQAGMSGMSSLESSVRTKTRILMLIIRPHRRMNPSPQQRPFMLSRKLRAFMMMPIQRMEQRILKRLHSKIWK